MITRPGVVAWPTPPHFHRDESVSPIGGVRCRVERRDASVVEGRLAVFQPEAGMVAVYPSGGRIPLRIPLDEIRLVRLLERQAIARDESLARRLGNAADPLQDDLPYTVHLLHGGTLSGRTRGFVHRPSGLYLFDVGRHEKDAEAMFIPAGATTSFDIGALLGQTLAHRKQLSPELLSVALDRQAALRRKKIGDYLAERGVLTCAELAAALERQQRGPAVKLGELLLAEKLITQEQLDRALAAQAQNRSRRLGDILVEMGFIKIRAIQMALAEKLGIPFVNVRSFAIDAPTLALLEPEMAVRYQALPLLRLGDRLVVAVENPLCSEHVPDLQFKTGMTVVPVIADPVDLRSRISLEYFSATREPVPETVVTEQVPPPPTEVSDLAQQLVRESPKRAAEIEHPEDGHLSDNTLVRLVNKMIVDAHAQGASDIHVESNGGRLNTRIRFRKDGDLMLYLELPPTFQSALVSRIKIMSALDISEHRHAQDGKIDFSRFGPLALELRVAIVPTANNLEDVVMRLLGTSEALPIEKLGLAEDDLDVLKTMVARSYGLILVCGPTGSGKTTTLHSILHHINREDLKIWTAEDPVEITQPGLRQVQINSRIGWSFADAMRAFLRADPDVIMVGEMRDAETAKIGIEASLTGHLVFSTLHTNSAAESATRLLEMGMEPFNFADALIGIMSQRLARRLCKHCKRSRPLSAEELSNLALEYCSDTPDDPAVLTQQWVARFGRDGQVCVNEPVGCDKCSSGFKGRLGIYELLRADAMVKQHVRARGTVPQILEAARRAGMRTLRQDALLKVLGGDLDLTGARAITN